MLAEEGVGAPPGVALRVLFPPLGECLVSPAMLGRRGELLSSKGKGLLAFENCSRVFAEIDRM